MIKKPSLLNTIKRHYPNPRIAPTNLEETNGLNNDWYCVGGALCLYLNLQNRLTDFILPSQKHPLNFPSQRRLSYALQEANPKLEIDVADYYAREIIKWNDDGEFKLAWKALREALDGAK